jgi:hypothetical protein
MFRTGERVKILFALSFMAGVLFMSTELAMAQQIQLEGAIIEAPRISPQDAYLQATSGKALLVCAYEDENTCKTMMLERAISLKEFELKLPGLKKDQPIIFYCA